MKKRLPMMPVGLAALALFAAQASANVILVQTSDAGYYNNAIGSSLNLSGLTGVSGTGSDTCSEPFPNGNDCGATYATQPNISAADTALGNWLTDPLNLNSNWNHMASIPNSWPVGTEVAVMYQFDTLGATGVLAEFGVDNGIYVWLDGAYLLGRRDAGGPSLGEYAVNIGNLSAGTHFLQLLLEDHGSANGYQVRITADTFTPGPPPRTGVVPEPASVALVALGLVGSFGARRKWRASAPAA